MDFAGARIRVAAPNLYCQRAVPVTEAPIVSPCVRVCIVDGESGLCLGCYRTLGEVAAWSAFSDLERGEILAELPSRRSRIRPEKLGMFGR